MTPNQILDQIYKEIDRDVEITNGTDMNEHSERFWPDRIDRQSSALCRILARHTPVPAQTSGRYTAGVECSTCRQGDQPAAWPCPEVTDVASIFDITIGAPR